MARTTTARLVALPPYRGGPGEIALDRDRVVIGRDPVGSDLVLAASGVSRRHAEVVRAGPGWLLRDLGSTNGTSVAGRHVTGPVSLRKGDVVAVGDVRLVVQGIGRPDPPPAEATSVLPPVPREGGVQVGDQWVSGTVNNVEGVQNNYVQHVLQQRESFLREVAATRTRARWFVWTGLALFAVGTAVASTPS